MKLLNDRKTLYVILSIVLISIFSLTIIYAALSVTLNISGNAEVIASSWDVHLANVNMRNGSAGNAPSITNGTTATFSTILTNPGDFYEFTIDVVNDGTIDAMIDSIEKTPTLTEIQAKYINYIIEYQNGESITTKQLVTKNSFVRLKVRVEFRKDITAADLPTTTETLNLAFTVNYIQSDNSGSSVNNNGVEVKPASANGSLNAIGTLVTIGSEQFYTIGTEGDNVKLLSRFNLHVGNSVDENYNVTSLASPTGMQSELALAYVEGKFPFIGTTPFSNTNSTYTGSIVEKYVNNYKTILETNHKIEIIEARLITKEELTNDDIGCDESTSSCSDAPSFITETSYWTETAMTSSDLWVVGTYGFFGLEKNYNRDSLGVRPVIIISTSNF